MFKPRTVGRLLNATFGARNVVVVARPLCREKLSRLSGQPSVVRRSFATSTPRFTTRTLPPDEDPAKAETEAKTDANETISPDKWIGILENTAYAPWLNTLPLEHGDRLKRAYTLLFQIVLYLGRPQEPEMAEQFLVAFGTAPTPPESEIGRARKAVAKITRAVVRDISSVPVSSPLRTEQTEVFNIFGALQALHDMYLMDEEVDNWGEFWSRAQPVVLSLGMKLDEVGFGLNLDEFEKAEKEKDEKEKEKGEEKEKEMEQEKMSTSSATLAGAPGECCFTGVKHTGTAAGRTVTIAGMQTYLSEPENRPSDKELRKVILYFSDIYGPFFLNGQLLQDYFASNGYTVLGCDYLFGDPVHVHTEPGFDRNVWVVEKRKAAVEAVPKWLEGVRELYGTDAKYCAVGYCFGGPFALDLATTNNVVAAAFAHPAFLNEDHFTKITKPLLMSCAETDPTFPLESRRRAEDLLIAAKAKYHIQVFQGVSHGFALRGNPEVEHEHWAKQESARGIIGWFNRFTAVNRK